jgi:thioredoxin-like negative regulator of GroEL
LAKIKNVGLMVLITCGLVLGLLHTPVLAKDIAWQNLEKGLERSKSENKKIYLHFYANWCGACRIMENKTFKDPTVIAYINQNFIPIKVNADREIEAAQLFRVRALPDNWFIAEDGKPIGHQPGYITPVQLKGLLKKVLDEKTGQ